ncbi:MAG: hypothetical protein E6K04_00285 [Methanobacteriota archaeon]|nr:MAG: hypothetical protein E6K04_00285 [Euryarchaeota archaeon]
MAPEDESQGLAFMFSLEILGPTGLDAGPELFSGQAALVGVILGVAVFLFFLLANALTYVGTRKKVVIPYLPRVIEVLARDVVVSRRRTCFRGASAISTDGAAG